MWEDFLSGKLVVNVRNINEYFDVIKRAKESGLSAENYDENRYMLHGENTCLSVNNGCLTYTNLKNYIKNRKRNIIEYKSLEKIEFSQVNHEIVDMKQLLRQFIDGDVDISEFDYVTVVDLDNHFVDKVVNLDLDVVLEMLSDDSVVFIR